MTTIRRSYAIFVESLRILAKDKEILIFPFLSGVITIVAFLSMVLAGHNSGLLREFQAGNRLLGYVVLVVRARTLRSLASLAPTPGSSGIAPAPLLWPSSWCAERRDLTGPWPHGYIHYVIISKVATRALGRK